MGGFLFLKRELVHFILDQYYTIVNPFILSY